MQKKSTAQGIVTPNDYQSILECFYKLGLNEHTYFHLFLPLNLKRGSL